MATTVKNVGRIPLQVGIILANGKKTSIRIMQRSPKPVGLPVGSRIDENWLALNGKNIRVKTTEVAKNTPVSVPAVGPSAAVATAPQSGTNGPVIIKSPEPAVADAPAEKAVASTTTNDTSKE